MDVCHSNIQDSFSDSGPLHIAPPPLPRLPQIIHFYHHVLSIILADLGKSELEV